MTLTTNRLGAIGLLDWLKMAIYLNRVCSAPEETLTLRSDRETTDYVSHQNGQQFDGECRQHRRLKWKLSDRSITLVAEIWDRILAAGVASEERRLNEASIKRDCSC